MKDFKKYDECLIIYSKVMIGSKVSEESIKDCIKSFEEFEDYEKCKDLVESLRNKKDK